mgnify:CR=1 FL=1
MTKSELIEKWEKDCEIQADIFLKRICQLHKYHHKQWLKRIGTLNPLSR